MHLLVKYNYFSVFLEKWRDDVKKYIVQCPFNNHLFIVRVLLGYQTQHIMKSSVSVVVLNELSSNL